MLNPSFNAFIVTADVMVSYMLHIAKLLNVTQQIWGDLLISAPLLLSILIQT